MRMAEEKPLTFMQLPKAKPDEIAGASVVVIGAAEASPYTRGKPSHAANAPRALREASLQFARSLRQFDFDLGATMFSGPDDYRGMVDAGDVATSCDADAENCTAIENAVRTILGAGAVPVVLGGDDSAPIPVIKAFEDHGPVTILQIDAHVDWADVIQGNPNGYGSPMRRAAEFSCVTAMVQVGIRGLGSGEAWQHDDARAWGSQLITSNNSMPRAWRQRSAMSRRVRGWLSRSTATASTRWCFRP
jgi:agmatinase